MKLFRAILLFLAIIFLVGSVNVTAAAPIKIVLNGKECVFPDVQPYVNEDSRTLVPIRFVAIELGASVEWNQEEQSVKITSDGNVILLKIDDYDITVNGKPVILDTKPTLKDGRTMVPLRFISETLQKNVEYQNDIVTITDLKLPALKINLAKKLIVVGNNIYPIVSTGRNIQSGTYTVKEVNNQVNLMTGETIYNILAQDGDKQFYIDPFSRTEEDIKITDENLGELIKQIKVGDSISVE